MTGQQGSLQVRQDRVVEAHDARKTGLPCPEPGQQVRAYLGFHGAMDVTASSQLAQISWLVHGVETTWLAGGSHRGAISDLD
ncbi:hypothetical protein GCM10022248_80140 [Nonomuraea soli]